MAGSKVFVYIKVPENAVLTPMPDGTREICILEDIWKEIDSEYTFEHYKNKEAAKKIIMERLRFDIRLDFPPQEEIGG